MNTMATPGAPGIDVHRDAARGCFVVLSPAGSRYRPGYKTVLWPFLRGFHGVRDFGCSFQILVYSMMIQIDRVLGLNPNFSCLRIGVRGNLQPCNQSIEALVGFPSVFNDSPIAISCHIPIYVYSIYSDIPYDSDISCFNPTSATFIYVYPIFPRSQ